MPQQLPSGSTDCTKASSTVMKAVPWPQSRLNLSKVTQFTNGSGVTVGVIDTGVAAKAPSLAGRVSGPAATDCVGHGTFLAGIIAAAPQPGVGFSGVAPDASIYAARGTDAAGAPSVSAVARGIRGAVDGGAKIIDVAVALERNSSPLTAAVKYAQQHDVVVIAPAVPDDGGQASMSNAATPSPTSYWPAANDGVVSVLDVNIDGERTQGSLVPVRADLAAPGQGVTGIGPVGKGHYLGNGASVASAFVAGAAALVRAYHPALSAQQVIQRLKATSYPADVPQLDIDGAVTDVLPTGVARGSADPDHFVRLVPKTSDGSAMTRALLLTGCCGLLGAGVGSCAAVVRRSRANRSRGS
ncbi:S8 family serine peptidase [Streptomyces canus]|uniref:S8 family serine peptidase n=1 Tax=Streptomyces canus TaxID=58343 RepID=UPI0033D98617